MRKLAFVIIDFKNKAALKKCLRSVKKVVLPLRWQSVVLVIDNNKTNLGFAKAVNVGIKKALREGAESILLLNQDAQIKGNSLRSLLTNKADVVAPVIMFKRDGRPVYDCGGKIDWRIGRTFHLERSSIFQEKSDLDYVSGCAMLIHRSVIKKIGLFDERFFLYFEDVDFCWRAKKAGFKIMVDFESLVVHRLREGKIKPFWQRWQLWLSNLYFINKWLPKRQRFLAYFYWLVLGVKVLWL